jgi:hypothetical protein
MTKAEAFSGKPTVVNQPPVIAPTFTPMETKIGTLMMEERKEPVFVEFADGECVEGVFVGIEKIEVGDDKKPTPRFTLFRLEDEQFISFLGTYQLCAKLRKRDLGHFVSVRYEGENVSIGKQKGNAMKMFKILISRDAVPNAHGLIIADLEIPF